MPRTLRVCSEPGCGQLVESGKCVEHRREYERARGSSSERGYDAEHRRVRRQWARKVKAGGVLCRRCAQPIRPDEPFDLDHRDNRDGWLGPSHRSCNRATSGR